MPLYYSLDSYGKYRDRVGDYTYIDLTRRTDPARTPHAWLALEEIVAAYGAPWVLQLWTKDPLGVLERGGELLKNLVAQGTTITAQVTVTGLAGTRWEPLVPSNAVDGVPALAAVIGGADHICWRYDPIIPGISQAESFNRLAGQMASYGVRRGVINFIAAPGTYKRVDRRLAGLLSGWSEGMPLCTPAWRAKVAGQLVTLAEPHGIRLACCAESAGLANEVPGLEQAACGDARWFYRLSGRQPLVASGKGSRKGCGCAPYYDIGNYGLWTVCYRCVYCYAG